MKFKTFFENISKEVVLFVGCTGEKAHFLLENGWQPKPIGNIHHTISAHGGQGHLLYLTNHPENAQWYGDTVLQVTVPFNELIVDPEDGSHDTVEEELANSKGLPGSVCATKPLSPEKFSPFSSID